MRSHQLRNVTPSPASECAPPSQRRGDTISCFWGANLDDWRKSLALCLLCALYKRNTKSANQMNPPVNCTVDRDQLEWLYGITPAAYQIKSILYQECTWSHQLRTMTLRSCINSVKSLYVITSTPYYECMRSHQLRTMNVRSLSTPQSKVTFIQLNQRIF
jgi:hypothetical protein